MDWSTASAADIVRYCHKMELDRAAEQKRKAKELERVAKETSEREFALADMERCEVQRTTLIKLLEAIEQELALTEDPKRITTLLSKQASTESRLYAIDRRRDRAFAIHSRYVRG